MAPEIPDIRIPEDLKPSDGRFGSGPSRVRPESVAALAAAAPDYLGTNHRQAGVRFVVGGLRNAVAELLSLPDRYEVLLGNGGTTAFWDAAAFGLIELRSQHLRFGEFSSKFAAGVTAAPHLEDPVCVDAEPGTRADPVPLSDEDALCLTHNETSTGVVADLTRPAPGNADGSALVLVDATSAAGAVRFDPAEVDVYYFAPQKVLGADGGLWLAACSPAAVARIERLASERWIPPFLDLKIALDNSRKDQTYNTPALATVFLALQTVEWITGNGGLEWAADRCDTSAATLYGWADGHPLASPFVEDPAARSPVVATIDLDPSVDHEVVCAVLRSNGIVDVEPYRKLGRNQLRVALFPSIDPADVEALTACLDHLFTALT